MSKVVYLQTRRTVRHPAIMFLANDWRRTVNDAVALRKLLRDYREFRALGLTRKAAYFMARIAL